MGIEQTSVARRGRFARSTRPRVICSVRIVLSEKALAIGLGCVLLAVWPMELCGRRTIPNRLLMA